MEPATIARIRMRAQRLWDTELDSAEGALRHLVAAQAQEFAYARWSLAQRSTTASSSAVQRAFDDGLILRTHILRPTWHFVSPRDLRWLMELSAPRVVAAIARRCAELGLDSKTLARSNDVIADAVARAPLTRRSLAAILDRRGLAPDGQRMPHMLMRAELDMIVCSGPLEGKQHTYAPFDSRVRGGSSLDRDDALGRLAKRYVASRGPATLKDFAWWSGLPMQDARRATAVAGRALSRMEEEGRTYIVTDEQPSSRSSAARVDLVQCYDEAIISYSESRDVLRTGSISFATPSNIDGYAHVILRDGRLLGHWRAIRTRNEVDVETRVGVNLDVQTKTSLEKAITRYRRFAAR
jgi:hypothetical protein